MFIRSAPRVALLLLALTLWLPAQGIPWSWTGNQPGESLGDAVAFVGDIDGDGDVEVAVGSPLASFGPVPSGIVRIYAATGRLIHTIPGESAGDRFGTAVSGLGDVDGDGLDDFAVGAPNAGLGGPFAGRVYVYSGATCTLLWALTGPTPMGLFGFSLARLDDRGSDGSPDFAIGAPGFSGAPLPGGVWVLDALTSNVVGTYLGVTGDGFGFSVARAGDMDGDGYAELLIGSPFRDDAFIDSGRVDVISGFTGQPLFNALTGSAANLQLGLALAGVGDVDGDQKSDILIAAPGDATNGPASGRVRLHRGSDLSVLHSWYGSQAGELCGRGIAGAGDINDDGVPDVLIGAPLYTGPLGAGQGRAFAASGGTGQVFWSRAGTSAGEEYGSGLAGAHALGLNPQRDVLAAAPKFSTPGGSSVGRADFLPGPVPIPFGVGVAPGNTLDLGWIGWTYPGAPFALVVNHAPPFGAGILALSTLPVYLPWGQITLLVDLFAPGSWWLPIYYDEVGSFFHGELLPQTTALVGLTVFMQASASTPAGSPLLSNGLRVTFAP